MADRSKGSGPAHAADPLQAGQRVDRWGPQRWITLRRIVQALALLAFVVLFIWSRRGGWPAWLVNAPPRLDPLAMLAHLLASRVIL
ncbi:MAG: hypothetical protein PVI07_06720, partial [Anaerolineae bacterium]